MRRARQEKSSACEECLQTSELFESCIVRLDKLLYMNDSPEQHIKININ